MIRDPKLITDLQVSVIHREAEVVSALRPKTEIPLFAAGWQRKWPWDCGSCTTPEFHVHCARRNRIPRVTKTKKKNKTRTWQAFNHCCDSFCCVSQTLPLAKGSQLGCSSWQQTRQTQPLMWSKNWNCRDREPQLSNTRVVLKHPLTNTPTAAPGAVLFSITSHLAIYRI